MVAFEISKTGIAIILELQNEQPVSEKRLIDIGIDRIKTLREIGRLERLKIIEETTYCGSIYYTLTKLGEKIKINNRMAVA